MYAQDRSFQIFSFDDALDAPPEAAAGRPGGGEATLPREPHLEAHDRATRRSGGGALKKLAATLFAGLRRATSKTSRSRTRDALPATYPAPSAALMQPAPATLPMSATFGCGDELMRRTSNATLGMPHFLAQQADTSSLTSASTCETPADFPSCADASLAQGVIWVRRDAPSAPPPVTALAASRQIPTSADLTARRTNSLVSTAV